MAKQRATITFKDVTKDGIPQIEVTAPGRIIASKPQKDDITWSVVNFTTKSLDVAVIDFYAMSTVSGGPTGGGYPFKGGKPPDFVTVPYKAGGNSKDMKTILADGDGDIVYKYSIVARLSGAPNTWFLVKDPELEMDL